MQMIDVLKRLAELDANNSNVIRESTEVAECGPMGMMGGMSVPEAPKTPATLNVTAGSAEELGNMLAQIMALAGVQKVEPSHLGVEPEPMSLTAEPTVSVGPAASDTDDMRSMISAVDKLNPDTDDEGGEERGEEDDEEETDEGQYDNSPETSDPKQSFNSNQFAHQENQPGSGETSNGEKRQSNLPTATYESLMAEYKAFVNE